MIRKDRLHRISTITCQVALMQQWKGRGHIIESFDTYFNYYKTDNGRQPASAIIMGDKKFIPDSLIHLKTNQKHYLYALEVHNGWDVKRIVNNQLGNTHVALISK